MKALEWVGSSKKDLMALPEDVRRIFGFALYQAQIGEKHDDAKPLKGFGSAGVLEVVESDQDGTYRAVYTVRFRNAVYVLHCFQKKSTHGIATSRQDINCIKARLQVAAQDAKEKGYG
jgi:phage-related protein